MAEFVKLGTLFVKLGTRLWITQIFEFVTPGTKIRDSGNPRLVTPGTKTRDSGNLFRKNSPISLFSSMPWKSREIV